MLQPGTRPPLAALSLAARVGRDASGMWLWTMLRDPRSAPALGLARVYASRLDHETFRNYILYCSRRMRSLSSRSRVLAARW
jgi:hypothetical protein